MADKVTKTLGYILLTILIASGVTYVQLTNQVKIKVGLDDTRFYVPHEDYSWIWTISGVEENRLFDGTSIMYRDKANIFINTTYSNITNEIYIIRTTPYQRGPVVKDTYYFDGDIEAKELFPISHTIEIFNGSGYYYRYTADDLTDVEPKRKLDGETYLEFGKNMSLELQSGYRWAWIGWPYGSDSVSAQYNIDSDYEKFEIRLFDPVEMVTVTLVEPANDTYTTNRTGSGPFGYFDFECNYTSNTAMNNITLYIWNSTDDIYYNDTKNITSTNYLTCYQESANVSNQSGTDTCSNLNYTGEYSFENEGNLTDKENIIDGDWNTYGTSVTCSGSGCLNTSTLYINYSKPDNINDGNQWLIKRYEYPSTITQNLSIISSCYDYNSDNIQLKINFSYSCSGVLCKGTSGFFCNNGSWISLDSEGVKADVYEEAIYWNVSDYTQGEASWNRTLVNADNYTWNCLVA